MGQLDHHPRQPRADTLAHRSTQAGLAQERRGRHRHAGDRSAQFRRQQARMLLPGVERRGEGEFGADVELTSSPDDPNRTIVGFLPFDTRRVELPFDISIDTGSIGGPSAGLAFTLTVIDGLSDGELTGGKRVAVTGTIDLDGSVGAIGGLTQKASAVEQAGVELLLVPTRQGDEQIAAARAAAPDLEIVAVATLDEAIDVLVAFGGERPNPSS